MRRVDGRRIIGPIAPFRVAEVRVGPAIVRPARPWGPGVPHHGVPGPRTSPPRAGRKQLGSGNMARSGASSRAVSQSASCRAAALARVPGRRAKRRPGATEERSCRATADAECTAACRPGRAPPRGWSGFVRQRAHCSPEAQRTGGEPMTRSRRFVAPVSPVRRRRHLHCQPNPFSPSKKSRRGWGSAARPRTGSASAAKSPT